VFRFYRYAFPGLIALVLGFRLGAIVLIRPAPVMDEPFHLKVTQQFGPGLPSVAQLRDYASASGPLFYVAFGNLGALVGYNLTALRLAVFVMSLASLLLFYRVLKRLLPTDNPLPAVALLATAPYFSALAGMLMTEHLALCLGLAALLCYLRFRDAGRPLDAILTLLFVTLAIYTRSFFIFLPAAFAINDIATNRTPYTVNRAPLSDRDPSLITHRSSLIASLLWLLPILAFVPMVVLWRGLAPPTFQYIYHAGFEWQNASSLLIWTGVVFLPWVWHKHKLKHKPWYLLSLIAIPLVLLSPVPGLGITHSALKRLPHPLALVAACLLGMAGLLWYIQIAPLAIGRYAAFRENRGQSHEGSRQTHAGTVPVFAVASPLPQVAAIGALLLAAGLLVSGPSVFERYLLPGIPLMLICARPGTKPGLALLWAGLFQLPLALAHMLRLAA